MIGIDGIYRKRLLWMAFLGLYTRFSKERFLTILYLLLNKEERPKVRKVC